MGIISIIPCYTTCKDWAFNHFCKSSPDTHQYWENTNSAWARSQNVEDCPKKVENWAKYKTNNGEQKKKKKKTKTRKTVSSAGQLNRREAQASLPITEGLPRHLPILLAFVGSSSPHHNTPQKYWSLYQVPLHHLSINVHQIASPAHNSKINDLSPLSLILSQLATAVPHRMGKVTVSRNLEIIGQNWITLSPQCTNHREPPLMVLAWVLLSR